MTTRSQYDILYNIAERWKYELNIALEELKNVTVKYNLMKLENKYKQDKNKKMAGMSLNY